MNVSIIAVAILLSRAPLSPLVHGLMLEAAGEWNSALIHYHHAQAKFGDFNSELSLRRQLCQRRSSQTDRIRDRSLAEWSQSMTLADSLKLYHDVLDQLSQRTPNVNRASPQQLFFEGAVEFERAVSDPNFRNRCAFGLNRQFAIQEVKRSIAAERIRTTADARSELRELVVRFVTMAPQSDGVAFVLQFVYGACASVDEWTTLQTEPKTTINSETISGVMLLEPHIGYLRITDFRQSTIIEFNNAVQSLMIQGMKALVIDLRGNQGGLLTSGLDIAKRVIPHGEVLRMSSRDPVFSQRIVSSESGLKAISIPLVVLIDTDTISTAEIVAYAIQSNRRGRLVGMPTFGKGTVQAHVEFKGGGGSRLIFTIATLRDQNGSSLEGKRIRPDRIESDSEVQLKAAVSEANAMLISGSS